MPWFEIHTRLVTYVFFNTGPTDRPAMDSGKIDRFNPVESVWHPFGGACGTPSIHESYNVEALLNYRARTDVDDAPCVAITPA